jgi:P-loop containing NTP hydrolase pore-1
VRLKPSLSTTSERHTLKRRALLQLRCMRSGKGALQHCSTALQYPNQVGLHHAGETSRLHQIVRWFGADYDGVIVFDEVGLICIACLWLLQS